MLLYAQDMIRQRQAILDAMGSSAAAAVVERIGQAVGVMTQAEGTLPDSLNGAEDAQQPSETMRSYRRPCGGGAAAGAVNP